METEETDIIVLKGSFGQVVVDKNKYISSGGSCNVFKGKANGAHDVAVKILYQKAKKEFHSQIESLKPLRHKNIVRLVGACQLKGNLYIITQYCKEQTLKDLIPHIKTKQKALQLAIQIASGMQYLHSEDKTKNKKKIMHRDLKPKNIFMGLDGNLKIGDFGLAKIFQDPKKFNVAQQHTSNVGTLFYQDIPIMYGKNYSAKCDVWAFGCILYQLLTKKKLFQAQQPNQLQEKIENYKQIIEKQQLESFQKEILHNIITKEQQRWNFQQILNVLQKFKLSQQGKLPKEQIIPQQTKFKIPKIKSNQYFLDISESNKTNMNQNYLQCVSYSQENRLMISFLQQHTFDGLIKPKRISYKLQKQQFQPMIQEKIQGISNIKYANETRWIQFTQQRLELTDKIIYQLEQNQCSIWKPIKQLLLLILFYWYRQDCQKGWDQLLKKSKEVHIFQNYYDKKISAKQSEMIQRLHQRLNVIKKNQVCLKSLLNGLLKDQYLCFLSENKREYLFNGIKNINDQCMKHDCRNYFCQALAIYWPLQKRLLGDSQSNILKLYILIAKFDMMLDVQIQSLGVNIIQMNKCQKISLQEGKQISYKFWRKYIEKHVKK